MPGTLAASEWQPGVDRGGKYLPAGSRKARGPPPGEQRFFWPGHPEEQARCSLPCASPPARVLWSPDSTPRCTVSCTSGPHPLSEDPYGECLASREQAGGLVPESSSSPRSRPAVFPGSREFARVWVTFRLRKPLSAFPSDSPQAHCQGLCCSSLPDPQ